MSNPSLGWEGCTGPGPGQVQAPAEHPQVHLDLSLHPSTSSAEGGRIHEKQLWGRDGWARG